VAARILSEAAVFISLTLARASHCTAVAGVILFQWNINPQHWNIRDRRVGVADPLGLVIIFLPRQSRITWHLTGGKMDSTVYVRSIGAFLSPKAA
jgi:hypothetical protein